MTFPHFKQFTMYDESKHSISTNTTQHPTEESTNALLEEMENTTPVKTANDYDWDFADGLLFEYLCF